VVHLQQRLRGAAAHGFGRLTDTRRRGADIESAARAFLVRAGLRELATNASYRFGELDLVMLDDSRPDGSRPSRESTGSDTLVFIEVRYRRDDRFGGGAASIDVGKRRRLVQAAQAFLATHRAYANASCRFDVIDAGGDPAAPTFTWLRDAFRADDA
jgi:putative endonuclease